MSEQPAAPDQPVPPDQPPPWQPPSWPPPPPYGAPPGWQPPPPPPPYGAPPGWQPPYGYPRPRSTNGFAIASLICSLAGLVAFGIGGVLGIVFGVLATRQIARTGEGGRGLAIAGLVVGVVVVVLWVLVGIVVAVGGTSGSGSPPAPTTLALHALS